MPQLSQVAAAAFEKQTAWCASLGSPFTARLLETLADDGVAGGVTATLLADWPGDPLADALSIRLAGALHALVLSGLAPKLAACYPAADPEGHTRMNQAVLDALASNEHFVQRFLASPPQTNEVGRSAVLVGGFHLIARQTGLPLRPLEIGASAGLNTIWDAYGYRLGSAAWGSPDSPVVLGPVWRGNPPSLVDDLLIAERAACDVAPVDIADREACLRLRAYVWADQSERLERLDAALSLARERSVQVEQADAGEWVASQLARPNEGRATVLYHSIMWQYLPAHTQRSITQAVHAAGARSTETAPLAWLRFEPIRPDTKPELHLTMWPGERRLHLASARAHGNAVEWHGGNPDGHQ